MPRRHPLVLDEAGITPELSPKKRKMVNPRSKRPKKFGITHQEPEDSGGDDDDMINDGRLTPDKDSDEYESEGIDDGSPEDGEAPWSSDNSLPDEDLVESRKRKRLKMTPIKMTKRSNGQKDNKRQTRSAGSKNLTAHLYTPRKSKKSRVRLRITSVDEDSEDDSSVIESISSSLTKSSSSSPTPVKDSKNKRRRLFDSDDESEDDSIRNARITNGHHKERKAGNNKINKNNHRKNGQLKNGKNKKSRGGYNNCRQQEPSTSRQELNNSHTPDGDDHQAVSNKTDDSGSTGHESLSEDEITVNRAKCYNPKCKIILNQDNVDKKEFCPKCKFWQHPYHLSIDDCLKDGDMNCFYCDQLVKCTGIKDISYENLEQIDDDDESDINNTIDDPQGSPDEWEFYWNIRIDLKKKSPVSPSKKGRPKAKLSSSSKYNLKLGDVIEILNKKDLKTKAIIQVFYLFKDSNGTIFVSAEELWTLQDLYQESKDGKKCNIKNGQFVSDGIDFKERCPNQLFYSGEKAYYSLEIYSVIQSLAVVHYKSYFNPIRGFEDPNIRPIIFKTQWVKDDSKRRKKLELTLLEDSESTDGGPMYQLCDYHHVFRDLRKFHVNVKKEQQDDDDYDDTHPDDDAEDNRHDDQDTPGPSKSNQSPEKDSMNRSPDEIAPQTIVKREEATDDEEMQVTYTNTSVNTHLDISNETEEQEINGAKNMEINLQVKQEFNDHYDDSSVTSQSSAYVDLSDDKPLKELLTAEQKEFYLKAMRTCRVDYITPVINVHPDVPLI